MRFKRFPHWISRSATPRRIAHSRRAIEREAQKTPLFAEQIRAITTPAERLTSIDAQNARWWRRLRDLTARQWRTARRAVQQLPPAIRQELLACWNAAPYPASSEYFADFVRHYSTLRTDRAQIAVTDVRTDRHAPDGTVDPTP